VQEYPDALIIPGFVDTHIHYPQTEMIASYGEQLLEWLDTYTFPVENRFSDPDYAREIAQRFLDELLRNGTTTALVFGTVHKESVESFFEACEARNLRMIAGKVMMDRNAPDYLLDTPDSAYQDSKELIEKWHDRGRLRYAVTPRFAPTSTPEQLKKAGQLLQEHPGVYLHTHMSENADEVVWVEELFPDCEHYLHSYDEAGLLGRRSVFAHCIHLNDKEWSRLSETQSNIAFCPSSNLFLGSGLFNLKRAVAHDIGVGLGTDVGGGTSFSLIQTMAEAYKVLQLRGEKLTPFKAFYLATLGGARALDLDDLIGNFESGKEADFIVLDKAPTSFMKFRLAHCKNLFELLFVIATLGDDRTIKATYSAGVRVHDRDQDMETI
jgi:guanine deaminase